MVNKPEESTVHDAFDLTGSVVVITGGAGLLGARHAEAVAEMGGTPILADIDETKATKVAGQLARRYGVKAEGLELDVTDPASVQSGLAEVLESHGTVDALVNNAALDPKVGPDGRPLLSTRFEEFSLEQWQQEMAVGLTGAFLCSQAFGAAMAERGRGVIVNVASDLALIGPDQRIYRDPGSPPNEQPVKSPAYVVAKSGLMGLTRYLATYWAGQGVRVNAICPGGVRVDQDPSFVESLTRLIPMGRMAEPDEYKAALVFLLSDASSYMTGASLVMDGGRTAW